MSEANQTKGAKMKKEIEKRIKDLIIDKIYQDSYIPLFKQTFGYLSVQYGMDGFHYACHQKRKFRIWFIQYKQTFEVLFWYYRLEDRFDRIGKILYLSNSSKR